MIGLNVLYSSAIYPFFHYNMTIISGGVRFYNEKNDNRFDYTTQDKNDADWLFMRDLFVVQYLK